MRGANRSYCGETRRPLSDTFCMTQEPPYHPNVSSFAWAITTSIPRGRFTPSTLRWSGRKYCAEPGTRAVRGNKTSNARTRAHEGRKEIEELFKKRGEGRRWKTRRKGQEKGKKSFDRAYSLRAPVYRCGISKYAAPPPPNPPIRLSSKMANPKVYVSRLRISNVIDLNLFWRIENLLARS